MNGSASSTKSLVYQAYGNISRMTCTQQSLAAYKGYGKANIIPCHGVWQGRLSNGSFTIAGGDK
jgi:hypothetical protein